MRAGLPGGGALGHAVRSRSREVEALFHGRAWHAESTAALRRPEHEALWGLDGAPPAGPCSTRATSRGAGAVPRSVGKPWPEGYRISDQGILNIAFGYRRMREMMDSYRRSRSGGARANGFPLHAINWGVVYVNDEQEFSVELLWVNPRWDARMGFTPLPMASRPLPDTHRVERTSALRRRSIASGTSSRTTAACRSGFQLDTVTLEREGHPAPNGVGAERAMRGPKTNLREQVLGWEPGRSLDYRLMEGAPISCHQGRVELKPVAGGTELAGASAFERRFPALRGLSSAPWTSCSGLLAPAQETGRVGLIRPG